MEFPDLGEHCSEASCKKLDFLPMKCDACTAVFCRDHIFYEKHSCTSSYKKDVQVPVCPLCNQPVPIKRGELPDIKVGEHIDRDCQSDPAMKKRNAYTNKCSYKRCKVKELMPVICHQCHLNYCLKHRYPQTHECGVHQHQGGTSSQAGAAAVARAQGPRSQTRTTKHQPNRSPQTVSSLQGGMNEDEALARALQLSMADHPPPPQSSQEEEDRILAETLAASEREQRGSSRRRGNNGCQMS